VAAPLRRDPSAERRSRAPTRRSGRRERRAVGWMAAARVPASHARVPVEDNSTLRETILARSARNRDSEPTGPGLFPRNPLQFARNAVRFASSPRRARRGCSRSPFDQRACIDASTSCRQGRLDCRPGRTSGSRAAAALHANGALPTVVAHEVWIREITPATPLRAFASDTRAMGADPPSSPPGASARRGRAPPDACASSRRLRRGAAPACSSAVPGRQPRAFPPNRTRLQRMALWLSRDTSSHPRRGMDLSRSQHLPFRSAATRPCPSTSLPLRRRDSTTGTRARQRPGC
jgi:hypothetical protein